MIEVIKSLEEAGFIIRQQHPEHGRILQIVLTPAGHAKVTTAYDAVKRLEDKMLSGFRQREQTMLRSLLERCWANLEAD